MRISHQWAPEIDARDRAARIFVAELQNRLPQTKISIHPQSSLGIKPLEQYQALLDGRIEMAIFPMFYISPQIPELSIPCCPPSLQRRNKRSCSRDPNFTGGSRSFVRAKASTY